MTASEMLNLYAPAVIREEHRLRTIAAYHDEGTRQGGGRHTSRTVRCARSTRPLDCGARSHVRRLSQL